MAFGFLQPEQLDPLATTNVHLLIVHSGGIFLITSQRCQAACLLKSSFGQMGLSQFDPDSFFQTKPKTQFPLKTHHNNHEPVTVLFVLRLVFS